MTRRWVRTFYTHTRYIQPHQLLLLNTKCIEWSGNMTLFIRTIILGCCVKKCVFPEKAKRELCVWCYLRSDLCSLLWIHHADVFKVFEGVLSVLLLGTNVLLQQAEDMARLQKRNRESETWEYLRSRGNKPLYLNQPVTKITKTRVDPSQFSFACQKMRNSLIYIHQTTHIHQMVQNDVCLSWLYVYLLSIYKFNL